MYSQNKSCPFTLAWLRSKGWGAGEGIRTTSFYQLQISPWKPLTGNWLKLPVKARGSLTVAPFGNLFSLNPTVLIENFEPKLQQFLGTESNQRPKCWWFSLGIFKNIQIFLKDKWSLQCLYLQARDMNTSYGNFKRNLILWFVFTSVCFETPKKNLFLLDYIHLLLSSSSWSYLPTQKKQLLTTSLPILQTTDTCDPPRMTIFTAQWEWKLFC